MKKLLTSYLAVLFVSFALISYGEVSDDVNLLSLVENAVKYLFERLDNESGVFVGVGIQFGRGDNNFVVKKVYKNKPAEKAGLQEGDVILMVNGKKFATKKFKEFRNEIIGDGKPGREVVFEILRGEKKINFTAVTDILRQDKKAEAEELKRVIENEWKDVKVKMNVLNSSEVTVEEIQKAIDELNDWFSAKNDEVNLLLGIE